MYPYRSILLCLLALLAGGCVTRADFEKVRREQREMRALLADTQVSLDKLKRRVDVVSDGGGTSRQSAAAVEVLEGRVAALEALVAQPGSALLVTGGLSPGAPRTEAAIIAWEAEAARLQDTSVDEDYRRGLQLYQQGQMEEAVRQLRVFLRGDPQSELADNAQFWMGEAYYSRGEYDRSIIELNEVLLKYPQGDRVPAALLALATAFANSGDKIDARLILQKLISDHPESREAEVGRQQLKSLTSE